MIQIHFQIHISAHTSTLILYLSAVFIFIHIHGLCVHLVPTYIHMHVQYLLQISHLVAVFFPGRISTHLHSI